jgi:hypothetical protein
MPRGLTRRARSEMVSAARAAEHRAAALAEEQQELEVQAQDYDNEGDVCAGPN